MKIDTLYRNDPERPEMDPVLELSGRAFVLRVYRGDFLDILGGTWFDPTKPPWKVLRSWFRYMPFIAWRWPFTTRGGYGGFKLYGVDSDNYRTFPGVKAEDVYVGSRACCLSFRPFANLGRG